VVGWFSCASTGLGALARPESRSSGIQGAKYTCKIITSGMMMRGFLRGKAVEVGHGHWGTGIVNCRVPAQCPQCPDSQLLSCVSQSCHGAVDHHGAFLVPCFCLSQAEGGFFQNRKRWSASHPTFHCEAHSPSMLACQFRQ
jgi:hypothetical protein